MKQKEAIHLIEKSILNSNKPQVWADLGCGSGTFTSALAHLLPNGSHIYAVDNQSQNFPKSLGNNVSVDFIKADFGDSDFNFSNLNGILMANSLHYIKDKVLLINRLEKYLSADKKFVIIEYDTAIANQWVPYPIHFLKLKELFTNLGYLKIIKLGEQQSIFGQGSLYSATIGINH
ncbi:class I SAM-dependent methyltransferase [Chryseobacterium sp. 22532]|uniref:class I SAM-dependent methyltransferase n=1 Tax=Chryseobacterium sp. 22532 TaxID=3453938 RepID=UPI003F85CF4A